MDIETHRAHSAAELSGDLSQYSVAASSNSLAVDRRRVPWDNRGTNFHSRDFFIFGRLRFLEPGSIPAASTTFDR